VIAKPVATAAEDATAGGTAVQHDLDAV